MTTLVPLKSVPNQSEQILLDGQSCVISVYQLDYGLFMDLYVSGQLITSSNICQNLNRIVRRLYFGFSGDFVFQDTQGNDDPVYTGLGSRFVLWYLSATELGGEG